MDKSFLSLLFLLTANLECGYSTCDGDTLPWSTYGKSKDSTNAHLADYEKLPDECCEASTMFIETVGKSIIGCVNIGEYEVYEVNSKEKCKLACNEQYKRWVIGTGNPKKPSQPLLCVAAKYIHGNNVCNPEYAGEDCRTCILYGEYPKEMGGVEHCRLGLTKRVGIAVNHVLFVKPQCSFGKIELYKEELVTKAPREDCNRNTLPWASVKANTEKLTEPNTPEGNIRVRLYEKLSDFCCSKFTAFLGQTAALSLDEEQTNSPCNPNKNNTLFLENFEWDEKHYSSDEAAKMACKSRCYTDYQEWVMGFSTRNKHCSSAVVNTVDRTCKLYATSSTLTMPNVRTHCALVIGWKELNWQADQTHELKPQCVLNEYGKENFGHVFGDCDSKTEKACSVNVHTKDILHLKCGSGQSMLVDDVAWVTPDESCTDMYNMRHIFNSRLRHEGYPREIEFHLEKLGVEVCGIGWGEKDTAELSVEYHCRDIKDMEIAPITVPPAYSILSISSKCQNVTTAFEERPQHTTLIGCDAYTTEIVSFKWRCPVQCMIYFLNFYNEKQFIHPGKLCRGAVVYPKDEDSWYCELYEWPIHEKPSEIAGISGKGCRLKSDAAMDKQLYLLHDSCYEAFTPHPGNWVLPWIPPFECKDPTKAFFKVTDGKEINCEHAYRWIPGEEEGNSSKTSAEMFEWKTGYVNEEVKQYVRENQDDVTAHEYYCKRSCLDKFYSSWTQNAGRQCRSVTVTVVRRNGLPTDQSWFCLYKSIEKEYVDICNGQQVLHGDNTGYELFREFVIKQKCYEPVAQEIEDHVEPPATSPILRPAPGFGRAIGQCAIETNSIVHFRNAGKKEFSCTEKTSEIFTTRNKSTAFNTCTLACLHMGKSYWFEADPKAEHSCKAFGATVTQIGYNTVNVSCQYYDWPAADETTCSESDHEEQNLFYSKCYIEPEGLVRRFSDCSKFILPAGGFKQYPESGRTVSDQDFVTIKYNALGVESAYMKIKCNNGVWEDYKCQDADTDEGCKQIIEYNKRNNGNSWHYKSFAHYASFLLRHSL